MRLNHRVAAWLLVLAPFLWPGVVLGQSQDERAGRRLAAVVSIAVEEYALGVSDGRVVSAAELDEARLFLDEARRLAAVLPADLVPDASRWLDSLITLAERLEDAEALAVVRDALRGRLADGLAISLDPLPSRAPALARGAEVYAASCAACHGEVGAGNGPAAAGLDPPPTAFTDLSLLRGTTPLEFFRKVSVGVAGTAMSGFEETLTLDDRWAVALYVSGLRYSEAERTAGREWITAACPDCLVTLSDPAALLSVADDSLAALVAAGAAAPAPPEAVAFARTAAAAEVLGGDAALAGRRVARTVGRMIDEAVALARAGDREAARGKSLEAYLVFEGIEVAVGARSGGAVAEVEQAFAALRAALDTGEPRQLDDATVLARAALDRAVGVLSEDGGAGVLFGQSVLIILREGLEALLIIGALAALLVKAGVPERRRDLAVGSGLAIAASVVAAVLFATVIRVTRSQQEAIEGITMLVASVVLFSAASWMVSKVEAEKWKAFVRARMDEALRSRRAFALAGVAFLAVFREGVETVLFYAALLGTAKTGSGVASVGAGFVAGAVVLAGLWLAMQRWGMRIPVRPFFAVTGVLLTVMAVSFAGQGVAELQAAGWVPATPLTVPAFPALGFFPTVQTVSVQVAVAVAFLVAVTWVFLGTQRVAAARPR